MRFRPRYGRIAAFAGAVTVTGVAFLAGVGVLPAGGQPAAAVSRERATVAEHPAAILASTPTIQRIEATTTIEATGTDATPTVSGSGVAGIPGLPADSGEGRRVVFDQSDQRVWLVGRDGRVQRSYPVSGSVEDNLDPGTYEVYSRSRHATGIDDSGTMEFMVRFARGQRAAIGFHSIPVLHGVPVQTLDELGTPLSHGCIRQAMPDAKRMWRFASVGTQVVVVA